MPMMFPGIAEVCNTSTSRMWPECPSRDTGRSGPIAEGDYDNDDDGDEDDDDGDDDCTDIIIRFLIVIGIVFLNVILTASKVKL